MHSSVRIDGLADGKPDTYGELAVRQDRFPGVAAVDAMEDAFGGYGREESITVSGCQIINDVADLSIGEMVRLCV